MRLRNGKKVCKVQMVFSILGYLALGSSKCRSFNRTAKSKVLHFTWSVPNLGSSHSFVAEWKNEVLPALSKSASLSSSENVLVLEDKCKISGSGMGKNLYNVALEQLKIVCSGKQSFFVFALPVIGHIYHTKISII